MDDYLLQDSQGMVALENTARHEDPAKMRVHRILGVNLSKKFNLEQMSTFQVICLSVVAVCGFSFFEAVVEAVSKHIAPDTELRAKYAQLNLDHDNLLHLKSRDWVTCACGNQCAIIPRHKEEMGFHQRGEPKDDSLSDLGCEFHECVSESDYAKAKMILGQIEAHSAFLIAEELAKLNAEPLPA